MRIRRDPGWDGWVTNTRRNSSEKARKTDTQGEAEN